MHGNVETTFLERFRHKEISLILKRAARVCAQPVRFAVFL
ncbi:hypothetical protein HMPREF1326_03190 [Akkermansia sp. KLE1605]|nr:hypothetical protein HMPREF1326_03190 [Akkermansia sp. KLE1605]